MSVSKIQQVRSLIVKKAYQWLELWKQYPNRQSWYWNFLLTCSGWKLEWGNTGICQAGANECWRNAGIIIGFDSDGNGIVEWDEKTATPSTAADWGKQLGLWRNKGELPEPGDILYTNEASTYHAAVVVEMIDNDRFKTVEFNLSSSVGQRTWGTLDARIVGYIKPSVELAMFV